jgi:hypothetical protein
VAKLSQPNSFSLVLSDDGAREFSVGAHKADEKANKLVDHKDPLLHAMVMSYYLAGVGNGVLNLSYKADS